MRSRVLSADSAPPTTAHPCAAPQNTVVGQLNLNNDSVLVSLLCLQFKVTILRNTEGPSIIVIRILVVLISLL